MKRLHGMVETPPGNGAEGDNTARGRWRVAEAGRGKRMVPLLRGALTGAAAAVFAGVIALVGVYPLRPASPGGWILWFLSVLPLWIFLEYISKVVLENRFITGKSRPLRIAYAVVAFSVLLILMWFGMSQLKPYLGRWSK